ncbi:AI-2E family transporter [Dysosmobacter sp.]|uniref:AI-2E family transporter n=1 Tax=Dysosmobacter sp. TaxID=2591382 RepID=UPI002A9D24E2|nr:AI-2E family transporter [Dysosmobacter sp.]MDY5509727.1 AI-2E family transporter [Dysosmobacter sp.]
MELNKGNIKGLLLVICGGVAFYCVLQNLGTVIAAAAWLLGILSPFLLGCAIAFILNVPMRAIERHLFQGAARGAGARRPLALLLTLVAVLGVLALASSVIGPGITDAVRSIASQVPGAIERLQEWLNGLSAYLPMIQDFIAELDMDWQSLSRKALDFAQSLGSGLLSSGGGLIGGVVSGVSTFVIGLIFSFYILLQKEKLARQGRQVIYALLPTRRADRALEVLRLAGRTFSSFLSGQCLEACILGTLFVAAMTIFRMPYALLVGVLIALTALIPIVGAFIGCGVGALLIAIGDPWKALWFIVLFLVLQQVEGNLIYPHVVGSSVGLPSIWVLSAVTLGGSLMGILGMLVFIPLCSVLYALFRDYVKQRLRQRAVPEEKWREAPPPPRPASTREAKPPREKKPKR